MSARIALALLLCGALVAPAYAEKKIVVPSQPQEIVINWDIVAPQIVCLQFAKVKGSEYGLFPYVEDNGEKGVQIMRKTISTDDPRWMPVIDCIKNGPEKLIRERFPPLPSDPPKN